MRAQTQFYVDVMGPQFVAETEAGIVLGCQTGDPLLIQVPGGRSYGAAKPVNPRAGDEHHLIFLGFMAQNVDIAVARLKAHKVRIIQDVTNHDWGGTDMLFGDADGNTLQVFQLEVKSSFKAALAALEAGGKTLWRP